MGCPNFTTPVFVGGAWGKRTRCKAGEHLPATLARLLMQLHGSSQVSPQSALGNESARARAQASGAVAAVYFAGVAQLVEHLFCKQVVAGSSPTASSAVGPRVMASGSHARGFRVLASFGLRSDAHALKCVPLRSSPKPRQNAELRARVIGWRPLGTAANVSSATVRESSESCPSGQREQAVNLPDLSYAGSNPALSTSTPRLPAGTNRSGFCFTALGRGRSRAMTSFAGVAQLVERQPSKLNVEGSSPFSRSMFSGSTLGSNLTASVCHRIFIRWLRGGRVGQPGCQVWPLAKPSRGPERSVRLYVSTGPQARRSQRAKSATVSSVAKPYQQPHAHLAQMVEHVLGKDEVTSSILVVGSKP